MDGHYQPGIDQETRERRPVRIGEREEDRRDRMILDTGRIYIPVCLLIRHGLDP